MKLTPPPPDGRSGGVGWPVWRGGATAMTAMTGRRRTAPAGRARGRAGQQQGGGLGALGLTCVLAALGGGRAAESPNIVFIMADDLGFGEVGTYSAGSPNGRIATPNLDWYFSQGGIRFTNAYAGYTVCAPSRTTLMTGRHSGNFEPNGLDGEHLAPGQEITLAEVLKRAGYRTALFGKSAPLTEPVLSGFDYFLGQVDQADCHNMYPCTLDSGRGRESYPLPLNQKAPSRTACMEAPDFYNYTTDIFVDRALSWLDGVSAQEDPFFLYLSLTVPHAGGWGDNQETGNPVPSDLQYAGQEGWPDVEKDHAASVTYMDAKIGEVMGRLQALGKDENTLVLFASDNGAHLEGGHSHTFFNSTGGLRGHKRSMYEGGVRSPSMARWPSRVKAGSVSHEPWAFWDVLPTLADVAGASALVPLGLDGRSFYPTLLNQSSGGEERMFYFTGKGDWAGDGTVGTGASGSRYPTRKSAVTTYAVRTGRWKAIGLECHGEPSGGDPMELYDLEADPFEKHDIADTAAGQSLLKDIKVKLISDRLSCKCFQC